MDRQKRHLLRRLIAAAASCGLLLSLSSCAKTPVETTTPKESVTAEQAITELQEQSAVLGFNNALDELGEKNTTQIGGDTYIRLQQYYEGVPVYGKTIVYAANEQGELTSVTGNVQDIDPNIDLAPSITPEQAQESIRGYAAEVLGMKNAEEIALEKLSWTDACIYTQSGSPVLAFAISIGSDCVILDAHDASILNWHSIIMADEILYTGPEGTRSVTGAEPIEGSYILKDSQRNIYVYDAQEQTYWYPGTGKNDDATFLDVPILVQSPDVEFGDGDDNTASSGQAYTFLTELGNVYDFFAEMGEPGVGTFVGICNDLMNDPNNPSKGYFGKNGGGGCGPLDEFIEEAPPDTDTPIDEITAAVVIFGSAYTANLNDHYDLFGHEYQHTVFQKHAGQSNNNEESGAINEGIADIMGELYESSRRNSDWEHGDRIIHNPSQAELPASVIDIKLNSDGNVPFRRKDGTNAATDYAHGCSTIISHSAYLMWNGIDGTESKRLSEQQLAELWYRAVLMMPSDCDFILCRQLVEVAAQSMEELTDQQRACVREAFDRVGIASSRDDGFHADYLLAEDATLSVYDQNNEPYSGYTLRINGTIDMSEIASNMTPDIGWVVNRTNTVEEAGAYALDLPQGCYSLTITDPHYDESYTIYVEISDEHTETNVDLITAYEEPLIVIIPQRKQLTRIDKYDQSGSVVNHKVFSYNDFGFLEEEVSRDIEQGECVFELQTTFTYDGNNRLISRITENPEYPGESSGVKYTYDNLGRITGSMAWEGGAVELLYEYDSQNRVIRTTEMYDAGSSVTEHTYDDCGRLIKDVRVSCEEWSNDTWTDTTVYSYDAEGRLSSTVMEGVYQTVTQVYDYSYLPFVIVDYCYNGGSHYFYAMLPDGSLDMMTTMVFEGPQFYTDEEGYLAKVIDNDDYWGTCVYEFYYNDEIAIPENGPFRVQTGEASESHTYDEAEALLYEHLVQIYGSDGLDVTQVNSAVYNGITLQMTISGESGAPIYVIEWYTVDLETGVVTKSETGSYVCDLW